MRWAALALVLWTGAAAASCRQALAIGMDVSGSVDAREYRLQTDGLANALLHPQVAAAFLQMPDWPVALLVYEWSGRAAQRVLVPWVSVRSMADLRDVAAQLRSVERVRMDMSTALGDAKLYGAARLAQQAGCARLVLDISGDGKNNTGPRPQDVAVPGITVNALVISAPERRDQRSPGIGELSAYFNAHVIAGPEAFVESALGFEDFEQAMVRKLKRELQTLVIGAAE